MRLISFLSARRRGFTLIELLGENTVEGRPEVEHVLGVAHHSGA